MYMHMNVYIYYFSYSFPLWFVTVPYCKILFFIHSIYESLPLLIPNPIASLLFSHHCLFKSHPYLWNEERLSI